jgi:hypothetical protein
MYRQKSRLLPWLEPSVNDTGGGKAGSFSGQSGAELPTKMIPKVLKKKDFNVSNPAASKAMLHRRS